MPQVEANGIVLEYVDRGNGPVLILVHGFLTDYRSWKSQMEFFSKEFRVIAYSRRCHYPNVFKYPRDNSLFTEVADLQGLIKSLGLKGPLHLFGVSFGGYVSTILARGFSEVKSLVLECPPIIPLLANTDYIQSYVELRQKMDQLLLKLNEGNDDDGEEATRLFVCSIIGDASLFKNATQKKQMMENVRTLLPEISALRRSDSFTPVDARMFKVPTLLVGVEHSEEPLRRILDALERYLPTSERVFISGSSTAARNDAELNNQVMNFLKRHA